MKTLYLIDGSNLIFRAYHALPPMSTKQGHPTGAALGFIHMLLRLQESYHPTHVAVVFDDGGRSTRTELYDKYKANRPSCPPDLIPQFQLTKELTEALGFKVLPARDVEADDIIATLAKKAQRENMRVVIVSSDKDLMQLCNSTISLLDTMKKPGDGLLYTAKEVEEKFGVTPEQLGDLLALIGDASDNIPGVKGIGIKTASQLIQQYKNIDNLLLHLDEIQIRGAEKVKTLIKQQVDNLRLSRQLVELHTNVPLTVELADLEKKEMATQELSNLLQDYEFYALAKKLGITLHPHTNSSIKPSAPAQTEKNAQGSLFSEKYGKVQDTTQDLYSTLQTNPITVSSTLQFPSPTLYFDEKTLQNFLSTLPSGTEIGLSLQFCGPELEPNARKTPLCGIGFYTQHSTICNAAYIPLHHLYLGVPSQLSLEVTLKLLSPFLGNRAYPKYVYRMKECVLALQTANFTIDGVVSDVSLASYLLDVNLDHRLWAVATRELATIPENLPPNREQLCRTQKTAISIETLEIEKIAAVATAEAEAALVLGKCLRQKLSPANINLLENLEIPLASVLAQVEQAGIKIDTAALHSLAERINRMLTELETEIYKQAGYELNINSPKQLQELLFEKLQLQSTKKTKTGQSTDAEVLEFLATQHPIAGLIHQHRTLSKLKNTYVDQLPLLIDKHTQRLHTTYNQVVAATGRLSSTDPNLQNIPIRTEMGRMIRQAFTAPENFVLLAADYSQIELRVLAHLSQDPILLESFRNDEDIHERTAIEMFGALQEVTADSRRAAKIINYGILYGLSEHGLASRLGLPRKIAKQYIEDYFTRYAKVAAYLENLVVIARKDGGATTLSGRFRPIDEMNAKHYQIRSYVERIAKNTPIQGTAADILKQAMLDVQRLLQQHPEWKTRMLLTVHDELVFEVPKTLIHEVADEIKKAMEKTVTLDIPLKVDVGWGNNWDEC